MSAVVNFLMKTRPQTARNGAFVRLSANHARPRNLVRKDKDFCDYQHGDSGTCQVCKNNNREDCVSNVSLTEAGMEDCLRSCDLKCVPLYFSDATLLMETKNVTIPSKALFGSPLSNGTTGRLVDCSNLILENESVCANANGSICLVEDFTRNTYYVSVVDKCAANGGIAMIIFGGTLLLFANDILYFFGYYLLTQLSYVRVF